MTFWQGIAVGVAGCCVIALGVIAFFEWLFGVWEDTR